MTQIYSFTPKLTRNNAAIQSLILQKSFDLRSKVVVQAKLNKSYVRFTFQQAGRVEYIYTGRLARRGTDEFIERLASLKVMIGILSAMGFAKIDTDAPALSSSA